MAKPEHYPALSAGDLRHELEELYAGYAACLDKERFGQDELTRVSNAGHYRDKPVVEEDRQKFREEVCVFDSLLVPNSLIYPL